MPTKTTASTPSPSGGSASSGGQRACYGRRDGGLGLQGGGDAEEEDLHLYPQASGDTLEHPGRRVLLAPFDLREVRNGDVRAFGDLPQGEPTLGAYRPQRLAGGREQVRFPLRRMDLQSLHGY